MMYLQRMTVNSRKRILIAPVAAAALFLVGCGSSQDSQPTPTASSTVQVDAVHNDADIKFAQMMIPHHEQALDMADMVPTHSQNKELITLAKKIANAQGPEIEQMKAWLAVWGAPTSTADSNGHGDHGSSTEDSSMHGMMSATEMQELENSTGAKFDRMWIEMMIKHHEGAVIMAKDELANGENPQAKALAQEIITSQEAEITQMKKMLKN